MSTNSVFVETSVGDLVDKITILQIKLERIQDPSKRENIARELEKLEGVRRESIGESAELTGLSGLLKGVNEELWDLEDRIRDLERAGDFGEDFVAVARKIYRTNDRRAALKKEINAVSGSEIIEEKSYTDY